MSRYFLAYGTLRMGHSAHDLLEAIGAEYIGDMETLPVFDISVDEMTVSVGGSERLIGEVYKIPDHASLDTLDWYMGDLFERSLRWLPGINAHVIIYLYNVH